MSTENEAPLEPYETIDLQNTGATGVYVLVGFNRKGEYVSELDPAHGGYTKGQRTNRLAAPWEMAPEERDSIEFHLDQSAKTSPHTRIMVDEENKAYLQSILTDVVPDDYGYWALVAEAQPGHAIDRDTVKALLPASDLDRVFGPDPATVAQIIPSQPPGPAEGEDPEIEADDTGLVGPDTGFAESGLSAEELDELMGSFERDDPLSAEAVDEYTADLADYPDSVFEVTSEQLGANLPELPETPNAGRAQGSRPREDEGPEVGPSL